MKRLIQMFLIFVKIGTFTLGGGYAMIPLIQIEVVEKKGWIDEEEFVDIIALAQTIPGALAINSATYIGYRLFGYGGAFIGCLGAMLPSVVIILFVAKFFTQMKDAPMVQAAFQGIRPAVVALIVAAVLKLGKTVPKTTLHIAWIATVLFLITVLNVHPIIVIILSGVVGYRLFKGDH
ncbi:MAG: chromate transporter [Bacillota bacterium]